MAIEADLKSEVAAIFKERWSARDGEVVPEPESLKLSNDAIKITGAVLYADLAESTELVNTQTPNFSAEVYKSYLHCAAKIIRSEGGSVTAYDGDRVMGIFIGDTPRADAARSALKINYAVERIINPAIVTQYGADKYQVRHAVGVDVSTLFAARTGVRGANDIVWVGRAANYAAKMCSLRQGEVSHLTAWVTADVYDTMDKSVKIGSTGANVWTQRSWPARGITVYGSNWIWTA